MKIMMIDTNVLLDYYGFADDPAATKAATELLLALVERGDGAVVAPHSLKDLRYIAASRFKKRLQEGEDAMDEAGAQAAAAAADALLEHAMDVCSVASVGQGDCHVARSLRTQHADFEDNLIAAVAMRIGAACIVTRDRRFAQHAPVLCLTPEAALGYIEAGVL